MMSTEMIDKKILAAVRNGTQENYRALFEVLQGQVIYFNLADDDQIELSRNPASQSPGIIGYISTQDRRLRERYISMPWEEALQWLVDFSQDVILVLQSSTDDWVGISQSTAEAILIAQTDNEDLNELVAAAGDSQLDQDFHALFVQAYNRYIFCPVEDTEARTIKAAKATNNLKVLVFFLQPLESAPCDALLWQDALQMTLDDPSIDGIIVQSNAEQNIAISREKVEQLLDVYAEWQGSKT